MINIDICTSFSCLSPSLAILFSICSHSSKISTLCIILNKMCPFLFYSVHLLYHITCADFTVSHSLHCHHRRISTRLFELLVCLIINFIYYDTPRINLLCLFCAHACVISALAFLILICVNKHERSKNLLMAYHYSCYISLLLWLVCLCCFIKTYNS